MELDANEVIGLFFRENLSMFTCDDFYYYLKNYKIDLSLPQIKGILNDSDFVFPLANDKYITRAGVFTDKVFSFKPSKEEIEKGYFVIGHRGMPFCNQELHPNNYIVFSNHENVRFQVNDFSLKLVFDVFQLFGDAFIISNILNDRREHEFNIDPYNFTKDSTIPLVSWPINQIEGGENIKYGDRILCRIIDWNKSAIEMKVLKEDSENFKVSQSLIDRENWYLNLENAILDSTERIGPCFSIEEQLSYVYLENMGNLITENCGSIEEFLLRTKKIGFQPYGIETRLWDVEKAIPFAGQWNKGVEKYQIKNDLYIAYSPEIVECFINDRIYNEQTKSNEENFMDLLTTKLPMVLSFPQEDLNHILLNIEKRNDIIRNNYSSFTDYSIAGVRKRAITLFSNICDVFCSIENSSVNVSELPQRELIIVHQLYYQLAGVLAEVEKIDDPDSTSIEALKISMDALEETFEEVSPVLNDAMDITNQKGFSIVSDN